MSGVLLSTSFRLWDEFILLNGDEIGYPCCLLCYCLYLSPSGDALADSIQYDSQEHDAGAGNETPARFETADAD